MKTSNAKSNRILEKGDSVYYGCYRYPNGAKWIARYNQRFYKIVHDGTGNEYFHSHSPQEITEDEAKRILIENDCETEGCKTFGWNFTDEEKDRLLGL